MFDENILSIFNDRNQLDDKTLMLLCNYLISFLINPSNSNFQENLQHILNANQHTR